MLLLHCLLFAVIFFLYIRSTIPAKHFWQQKKLQCLKKIVLLSNKKHIFSSYTSAKGISFLFPGLLSSTVTPFQLTQYAAVVFSHYKPFFCVHRHPVAAQAQFKALLLVAYWRFYQRHPVIAYCVTVDGLTLHFYFTVSPFSELNWPWPRRASTLQPLLRLYSSLMWCPMRGVIPPPQSELQSLPVKRCWKVSPLHLCPTDL